MPTALIIGNSDGIGLALTRRLLDTGWEVAGASRSDAAVEHPRYRHRVVDVRDPDFPQVLAELRAAVAPLDVCVYCAGIGVAFDPEDLDGDAAVFAINLTGAVIAAGVVVPEMVAAGRGHFVGLSSQGDRLIDPGAPSYAASKAGLSTYLEGLALALRDRGVSVTNVRFGFVDTKLSRGQERPFLMSADAAAALVMRCLDTRPVRFTRPRRMALLLALVAPIVRAWRWLRGRR
jgi:NAD(P)-dependent dehydrogenase (short-subunit alcohol dehydrogenase family)